MSPAESDREHLITRAFVSLADTLVDEYDVIDLLDRLVGYSVELLAADAAGIVLADARGGLRAVAASSEHAQLMELLQLQSDQGPCLDCVRSGSPVNVIDLTVPAAATDGRSSPPLLPTAWRSVRSMRCHCGCAGRRSGR